MKKVLILALAVLFVMAAAVFAGEYHQGSRLSCYQCHTMHYSQQHPYGYAHEDSIPFLGPGGPYNYLLRDEVNRLCLSCHDGGDVVDVYQASDVFVATNRESGFLNKVGDANTNSGHTLYSTSNAPGGNPTWAPDPVEGLTCVDCHNQHGYFGHDPNYPDTAKGQWRILKIDPGNATAAYLTYDRLNDAGYPNLTTRDIQWRATSAHSDGAYETDVTDFYEPVANASHYGEWCQGCHTDFHGNSGDANMNNGASGNDPGWIRHPTAEANIGGAGGGYSSVSDFASHPYRPQVMSPTGDWGPNDGTPWSNPPTDLTPSCFSCHKAHGNNNAFGLHYLTGNSPRSENGDATKITDTCKICHVQ